MFQSITLAQAWPIIGSVVLFLIGGYPVFVWRYINRNDDEHKSMRDNAEEQLTDHAKHDADQHKEFYDRLRQMELTITTIKAQHNKNHE